MKVLAEARRCFFVLLILSAVSLLYAPPGPVRVVSGFLQAYYLPGLVFFLFLGDRQRQRLDNIFFPPLLSPVIITLLIIVIHVFTGSFLVSMKISFLMLYLLLVAGLLKAKYGDTGNRQAVPNSIFLISIFFSSIIIISYVVNDYLFTYDMVRHSGITNEILYRGVPPLEPFFPDIPIRTMWTAYVFHAAWKELSGLSIFHSMWFFNLVNIFTFPYLIARLTCFFTDKHRYVLTAPFFALAGLDSASWIIWPLAFFRAFTGEVRGMNEVTRMLGQIELNGRNIVNFLAPLNIFSLNLLDKHFVIGMYPYALNLILLCLIVVLGMNLWKRSGFRAGITILLTMIGSFLFYIFTGTAFILASFVSGIFIILIERFKGGRKPPIFLSAVVPGSAIIAAATGLAFFAALGRGLFDGVFIPDRVTVNLTSLITIILPLVILLPYSRAALKGIFSSDRSEYKILAAWILSFLVVSIFFDIHGTLENCYILPLFILLIIPISRRIVDRLRSARGVRLALLSLWFVLLFFVPPALTVRGYMLEKPKTPHFTRRYRITDDERRIFGWIRDKTEPGAAFIERNEYNVMSYYAQRRNFYMTSYEMENFGYKGEKIARYREIRDEIYSDQPISAESIELLRNFEFDIYAVVWIEDLEINPDLNGKFRLNPEWFENVYENPGGTVYRVKK